jgi:hypothetical protein
MDPACDSAVVFFPFFVAVSIVGGIGLGTIVEGGGGGEGAPAPVEVDPPDPTTSSDLASSSPGPPL